MVPRENYILDLNKMGFKVSEEKSHSFHQDLRHDSDRNQNGRINRPLGRRLSSLVMHVVNRWTRERDDKEGSADESWK